MMMYTTDVYLWNSHIAPYLKKDSYVELELDSIKNLVLVDMEDYTFQQIKEIESRALSKAQENICLYTSLSKEEVAAVTVNVATFHKYLLNNYQCLLQEN